MTIELRTATDTDFDELVSVDARAFLTEWSDAERVRLRGFLDLDRFRLLVDAGDRGGDGGDGGGGGGRDGDGGGGRRVVAGRQIVGVAGSYELDTTLPGGATVPIGGVTWVSVASTHRRQGLLRRLMDAVHDDIDERGAPLAMLGASESGIYGRFGYGIASINRHISIDTRITRLAPQHAEHARDVRYVAADAVRPHVDAVWERFRRLRPTEMRRDDRWTTHLVSVRAEPSGSGTAAHYLCHPEGYAVYRAEPPSTHDGLPDGTIHVVELCALTPAAHAGLWATILSTDLATTVRSGIVPMDDPLMLLLDNPRALTTTAVADGLWANVRDPAICFSTRTYGTDDALVVEADGVRWRIEGSPQEAHCTKVRSRPDLVTDRATLGSLLFGSIRPGVLLAGGRLAARTADVVRRADAFFVMGAAPHAQTHI